MRIHSMGDRALLIDFDERDAATWGLGRVIDAVLHASRTISAATIPGISELVPAAQTLLVTIDPHHGDPGQVHTQIRTALETTTHTATTTTTKAHTHHVIDVDYTGEDLIEVAAHYSISVDELIHRHTTTTWAAAFGGFAPGFAYLVSDDDFWSTPRRAQPRPNIPAGSVALAGEYSGIYPQQSPGGWQIIGHTTTTLFNVDNTPPNLIAAGDTITFRPTTTEGTHP